MTRGSTASVALCVAAALAMAGAWGCHRSTATPTSTPTSTSTSTSTSAPTIVSLTFDDTDADQMQAAGMLAAHGMHATFYANASRLDQPGYLTRAQALELVRAGHEIGGHTVSHRHLSQLSPDDQRREICDDRTAWIALGVPVTTFAYPYGDHDATTERVARECGYRAARRVGNLVAPSCPDCGVAETVPPLDPFSMRTPPSLRIDTPLSDAQGFVTRTEEHGGGWVILVMHHVCDRCDKFSVTPATLGALLDWLGSRKPRGTVVKTVAEVLAPEPSSRDGKH